MKQTRTSFNGGEIAREMDARCDVDVYMRGCRVLENWELSPLGGVSRRRGMRQFAKADMGSRLFAYVYSYVSTRYQFLVVVQPEVVRVYSQSGELAAELVAPDVIDIGTLHVHQVNADMYICSGYSAPCVLRMVAEGSWTLGKVAFKTPPWRYVNEKRDWPVVVCRKDGGDLSVDFSRVGDADEGNVDTPGILRASFMTQEQTVELKSAGVPLRAEIRTALAAEAIGTVVAYAGEETKTAYVCKQEWPKKDVYADGLSAPACYPDNFEKADDTSGFAYAQEVWDVGDVAYSGENMPKGTKFMYVSAYWEYFTCIKTFTPADMVPGLDRYEDYPEFFRRGIDAGKAVACKGKWNMQVHGTWAGEYAVMRNFETDDIYDAGWEVASSTVSPIGNATLTPLSGDEGNEECYLRLFLVRSQRYNASEVKSGLPSDNCENRLVVHSYRHDMMLRLTVVLGGEYEVLGRVWEMVDRIPVDWYGVKTIWNWSWEAFCDRYGYPSLVQRLGQRLVFAGTNAQPQCLWLSQTGDFTNFDTDDSDTSAIVVTLATDSQNPICWMEENRNKLLLGTCSSEFIISGGDGAITATSLGAERHDNAGSQPRTISLLANNKVLFIERGGGRCYAFGFEMESDSYCSRDLTVFSPQVLNDHGGAVRAAMLNKPYKVAVFALADGQVALMTYNSEHQVNAWHRWVTDGRVLDVCALPDEQRQDRLFLLVEREEGTNIEVVDAFSGYTDNGERGYVSTLVTNPLGNTLEQEVGKGRAENPHILLGAALPTDSTEVSCDGENWSRLSQLSRMLPRGWSQLNVNTMWGFERVFGIRCGGGGNAVILSVQA